MHRVFGATPGQTWHGRSLSHQRRSRDVTAWNLLESRLRRRVARNVFARRKELGLSREAAAHEADMDVRHWAKVETGDHGVTLRTLAKLAVALRVEPSDLLK